jgi:hypothetical protein
MNTSADEIGSESGDSSILGSKGRKKGIVNRTKCF